MEVVTTAEHVFETYRGLASSAAGRTASSCADKTAAVAVTGVVVRTEDNPSPNTIVTAAHAVRTIAKKLQMGMVICCGRRGGGASSFVACLSYPTMDHVSLSRRSTVPTRNRGGEVFSQRKAGFG